MLKQPNQPYVQINLKKLQKLLQLNRRIFPRYLIAAIFPWKTITAEEDSRNSRFSPSLLQFISSLPTMIPFSSSLRREISQKQTVYLSESSPM